MMLTFDRVLEVFSEYLAKDDMYEVVTTSHGYTVLEWNSQSEEWIGAKLCRSPAVLANELMYGYTGLLEYQATLGRRDLNDSDRKYVDSMRQKMLKKLNG